MRNNKSSLTGVKYPIYALISRMIHTLTCMQVTTDKYETLLMQSYETRLGVGEVLLINAHP